MKRKISFVLLFAIALTLLVPSLPATAAPPAPNVKFETTLSLGGHSDDPFGRTWWTARSDPAVQIYQMVGYTSGIASFGPVTIGPTGAIWAYLGPPFVYTARDFQFTTSQVRPAFFNVNWDRYSCTPGPEIKAMNYPKPSLGLRNNTPSTLYVQPHGNGWKTIAPGETYEMPVHQGRGRLLVYTTKNNTTTPCVNALTDWNNW